ncbi:MAG: OB-fold nucleic acid binding domain-containing protein, partial [Burkholderiaceae bacterium]
GQNAIDAIVAERKANGPFEDIFDLALRVDKQLANRRVIEALVKSGAFDALDDDRAKLLASVGRAIEAADNAAASANQESLFSAPGETERIVEYVKTRRWSEREKLSAEKTAKLSNEKAALGFYLSGHLFTEFRDEARRLAPTRLADVKAGRDSVRLTGIVVSVRQQQTRRGRMGVLTIDDGSAQLELMIYSEVFDRRRALLKEDELVFVSGKVRFDEFSQRMSVSAEDVMDMATARANSQAILAIEFEGAADLAQLKTTLEPYKANGAGGCRMVMSVANDKALADLLLPDAWRVKGDQSLVEELRHVPQVRAANYRYT